jgi:TRAP transporter TAXI family solute receptor
MALTGAFSCAAGERYVLATASPGGTYYPVGTAIATLVKAKLSIEHHIEMVAIPTAGSAENLALMQRGEADFAIVQALVAYDAWNGGKLLRQNDGQRDFRAVTALWPNVEQFVLHSEHAKTGTIDDLLALKGASVGLGDRNSGTLLSNRILLGHLGIDIERDFRLSFLGYGPATDALKAREIVAVGIPAGLPTKSLSRIKAAMGSAITILGFTPAQAARADGGLSLWSPYTIPARTYPDQPRPVSTIAQPNLLAVRADVSEADVYQITRVLYERRDFLKAMHSATAAIDLSNALVGLPAPLHEGARRYFEEAGLQVPDHLLAP